MKTVIASPVTMVFKVMTAPFPSKVISSSTGFGNSMTLTRIGGGSFNLFSFEYFNDLKGAEATVTATFSDNSKDNAVIYTRSIDPASKVQKFTASTTWLNLKSLTITAGTQRITPFLLGSRNQNIWLDNFIVSSDNPNTFPVVTVAPTNASQSEGNSGTKAFTFTLTRSGNTTGVNDVSWAVTGSGTNPANATDFGGSFPSGTISFAAGDTSKLITVNVQGDTTVEPDENFTVTLSGPTNGATITTATAIGTILNDDVAPATLAIAPTNASQTEGNSGTKAFTFTLTRSGNTTGVNDVTWAVTGSGTNPANATDFGGSFPSGTISFAAGDTSKLITVNVQGDTTVEPDENFTVTLSGPTNGATITTATAIGTILNDDVAPATLAIAPTNASQTEGNSGTKAFTFTLTRSGNTTGVNDVSWAVTGSGTNPANATDFGGSFPSGTVSFAAGDTSKLITVNVQGDTTVEPDENFTVTLSGPTNGATITTATAIGTILNDDENRSNFSLYMIGNSLTDQVRYSGLATLAQSRGLNLDWGRHMIPGSSLDWTYDHPTNGFQQEPYGYYNNALPNYTWNAITLQPFCRLLPTDMDTIHKYLALLNPQKNTAVYIYAQWPDTNGTEDWQTKWNKSYTGNWDWTNMTKNYYETLTTTLRSTETEKNLSFYMIPVGHVMQKLDQLMMGGLVPGYGRITDIYKDTIHLDNIGSYIAATTFYATIFKQNPVGLPVPSEYQPISNNLATIIQDAVWNTVTTIPLTGL
jgi:hypothetical protein